MNSLQRDALASAVDQLRELRDAQSAKWACLEGLLHALSRPNPPVATALEAEALEYELTGECELVPALCGAMGVDLPPPSTVADAAASAAASVTAAARELRSDRLKVVR